MKKLKPCYLSDGTKGTGRRIIEELMKIEGATNMGKLDGNTENYYFLDEDKDVEFKSSIPEGYVLTPLPKETKELTFPRWMMCGTDKGRDDDKWYVISNFNNRFQAIHSKDIYDFDNGINVMIVQWTFAKEIEVEQPKEEAKEETDRITQLEQEVKRLKAREAEIFNCFAGFCESITNKIKTQ